MQLVAACNTRRLSIAVPIIIAKTGWTTDELQVGIAKTYPKGIFDLVSLQIGVNNQYRGRSVEEYRQQFCELLEQGIEFAGGDAKKLLVLSIPDWSITPFAKDHNRDQVRAEIDQFNTANRSVSKMAGVHYIDITPSSRKAAQDQTLLASDGLHPSGKMYATWVKLVKPVALEVLGEKWK